MPSLPSLLRRKSKDTDGNGSAPPQAAAQLEAAPRDMPEQSQASMTETAPPEAAVTETGAPATTEMPAPPPRPPVAQAQADYEMPRGQVDLDRPPSFDPAPPPPDSPRSSGSLIERAFGTPGETTAEERDRIAQAEFEQAIAPVLDLMRAAVPGAGTPEEAARILSENQPEPPEDPNPGAYVHGDAFDADARVYYRLLRRDYEKNPRPSEKKPVSHHLHGAYSKLPGTRGW